MSHMIASQTSINFGCKAESPFLHNCPHLPLHLLGPTLALQRQASHIVVEIIRFYPVSQPPEAIGAAIQVVYVQEYWTGSSMRDT